MIRRQLAHPELRAGLDAHVPMPLRGPATAEDVARVIGWLVDPTNTLVTGQVLYADGGADAVVRGDAVW
ncbi:SDR family oxidoreductase [Candidatus Protofrankia californiensis]|uniref:SDR family oxidoreductase n=1 Tax=Candidatus Protofrankia californiensis TaxID=1839754 RepID=UPI0010414A34